MAPDDNIIKPLLSGSLKNIIGSEELIIEIARELIKDEIKRIIRQKLNENPELRKEFKDAIGMYFEAKVKEAYAGVKLAKSSAKLGLELIPEHLRAEMSKELQEELNKIIEKTL
ncbi:MAG: hypothetical protein JSV49_06575 [Thermoplasmata archaeon]|nr:MAG: hypothetical protein JSV49_06575 [Thermoplasmata archaeon]